MLHPEVWAEFARRPHSLGTSLRDHPAWHGGRARYFVWAVDVSVPQVEDHLRRCRERLGARLLAPYERRAHVTVAACGFLRAEAGKDGPRRDDDVSPARLARQEARLRALRLPPFTLVVGGTNSFASAPFLEVADEGGALARLRTAVIEGGNDFRTAPYVPHVTIGIYSGSHATEAVAESLSAAVETEQAIGVTVGTVGLYSYAASDIASPLGLERTVTLMAPTA
jgi:2'-5' RNA ligase